MSDIGDLIAKSSLGAPRRTKRQKHLGSLELAIRHITAVRCDSSAHMYVAGSRFLCGRCKALEVLKEMHGDMLRDESEAARKAK